MGWRQLHGVERLLPQLNKPYLSTLSPEPQVQHTETIGDHKVWNVERNSYSLECNTYQAAPLSSPRTNVFKYGPQGFILKNVILIFSR